MGEGEEFKDLCDNDSLPEEWRDNNILFVECSCGNGFLSCFGFNENKGVFVIGCPKCGNEKELWKAEGGIWSVLSSSLSPA